MKVLNTDVTTRVRSMHTVIFLSLAVAAVPHAVHALPDRRAGAAARRPLAEGVTAQSKIIYADQIAPGWAFHSLAAESHSTNLASNWTDSPGVGINRSSAICTTLQASDIVYFNCQQCSAAGYQPFALSNSSGFSFWVRAVNGSESGMQAAMKSYTLFIGIDLFQNNTWTKDTSYTGNIDDTGFMQYHFLLQNLPQRFLLSSLPNYTSFGLKAPDDSDPVSFCIDEVMLLPSTTIATRESQPRNGPLNNCRLDTLQPVDQFGSYSMGESFPAAHNLTGATPAASYASFNLTIMADYADLFPVMGTCFGTSKTLNHNQTLVDNCTMSFNYNECCFRLADLPMQEEAIPEFLADLCNTMSVNGSVCQAFDLGPDYANFRGQAPNLPIDLTERCFNPNWTTWVLNAALEGLPDQRPIVSAATEGPLAGGLTPEYCSNAIANVPNKVAQLFTQADEAVMTPSVAQNVTNETAALTFIVYPHVALPGIYPQYLLKGESCFGVSQADLTPYMIAVNNCKQDGVCCIHLEDLLGPLGPMDSSVPPVLAQLCNSIWINDTSNPANSHVCQGWDYDSVGRIVTFKGQPANNSIDPSTLCYSHNYTLWLLNAAIARPVLGDTRVQPGSVAAYVTGTEAGPDNGHDASAAYAAIAAILGPGIPIVAWLIVTYSYRQDKIMIIREVGKNVTEAELGGKASSSTSERGMSRLLSSRQNSETPLIVNNPLAAEQPRAEAAPPPPDVQTAARKIAARCLRRWDAFLGFRAGRDGLGNPLGVWKTKFDGVRFAVLLLAMRKLNQHLQLQQETSAPDLCEASPTSLS